MLKKFLKNCKKPTGKFGKMIVSAMNKGHAPLALWAFEVCPLKDGESVLDVGCGGGGNLVRILERCPKAARTASIIRRKALHAAEKRPKNMQTDATSCVETPCGCRIGTKPMTGHCPVNLFISGPIPCRGSKKCSAS